MQASTASIALLALMSIKGFGRRTALKIINELLEDPRGTDCFRDAFVARACQAGAPKDGLLDAWTKSMAQSEQCQNAGIDVFSFFDAGYPKRLRDIPDPPAAVFVKGKTEALHGACALAVVGTRQPTSYGAEIARRFARRAAESGFIIISGLAQGCDTFAHLGSLDARGFGVAVLAHGLDAIHPVENHCLAERLLEADGCLVREHPVGIAPVRSALIERDRIQSGLADAVLVVETGVKGGTMHTVRYARNQRRPVACVAHPKKFNSKETTKGNQYLVNEGWAMPIPNDESLIRFLNCID